MDITPSTDDINNKTPSRQRKENPDEHALVTRIPKSDLARIDKLADACGVVRSKFTAHMIHAALDGLELNIPMALALATIKEDLDKVEKHLAVQKTVA